MRRILPVVFVLALILVVVVRLAGGPDREAARKRLEGPGTSVADVDRFLQIYGHTEDDRWAAARAYFRLQKVPRAVATVWKPKQRGPYDPATLQRFAEMGIRELGWAGHPGFAGPTVLGPLALCALADAGREDAIAHLREVARTLPAQGAIMYYLAAYQRGTQRALGPVIEGLRERADQAFEVAAAMAAMRPSPYAEREQDLEHLRKAITGELREQDQLRWASACVGYGRSEEPAAREVLREIAQRLGASENPNDLEHAALAANGVIASGDWSLEALVLPYVDTTTPVSLIASWYAHAVQTRMRRGDPMGLDRMRRLWRGPSQPAVPDLRSTLATRLFLQDDLAAGDPLLDEFVRDLTTGDASLRPVDLVVGHAARLRRGEAEAAWDLLAAIEDPSAVVIEGPRGASPAPHAAHPSITALRALLLYTGSSTH